MKDKVQSYQDAQDERTEIMRQFGYEPDGYDTMFKRHPEVKKRMNMKNSHQPEGEVIDERKMTDGEMQKEKKLRKKYDKGDMKKSMKDQYGEEEGKKIYFAKIRKIAMEGKYSSGSVTYVRGTAPVRDPRTGESYPKETYKKKGMVKTAEEVVREGDGDPCWDTHKQVGMKKKGGKMVPNCVPKEEVLEMLKKILTKKSRNQ